MDAKHIVSLSGKEYVLYAGLLAEAHERGLQAIETEVIQIPTEENAHTAIARAVVRMKDGTSFEEFGDANPRNVNARIATAILRMALTRAKGRALRDAINVGVTMAEELPDLEETPASHHNGTRTPHPAHRESAGPRSGVGPGLEPEYRPGNGKVVYRREDLIAGYRQLALAAEVLSIPTEGFEPDEAPNAKLLSAGTALRQKIKDAEKTRKATA